jgi:hypothetical protein
MANMKTKIYIVSNIDNDPNKVYIGKTKNSREHNHRKTFGDDIVYNIIDEVESLNRNDWEPLETKWIQHYIDLEYNVVNKRKKGGSGPEYHNDESKQTQSKKMKGRSKPDGFGEKISLIKKNIPNLKNKIKPLGFGEKLRKPHNGGENISKAKQGKPSNKKGKIYGVLIDSHLKNINRKKTVLQLEPKNNDIVREWESRNTIKKEIGAGIVRAIRTGKIYKEYYWKYK